jgi:hypothetical protein
MRKLQSLLLTGALLLGVRAYAVFADPNYSEHREAPAFCFDLKSGYPLQVQDAFSIPAGEVRFQSIFLFDRRVGTSTSRGDLFTMQPEAQWGITPDVYLRAMIPVYTGSGPTSTSGDVLLGGFYNFLNETNNHPAMGLSFDVEIPTGTHSKGLDTLLYYYVTKSVGWGIAHDQIHANIGWIHNSGAYSNEREDFFVFRAGYSRMFSNTLIGVDFVRQKIRQQNITENIVELGGLRNLSRALSLSLTLGLGIADESPEYRIGGGVQIKWH